MEDLLLAQDAVEAAFRRQGAVEAAFRQQGAVEAAFRQQGAAAAAASRHQGEAASQGAAGAAFRQQGAAAAPRRRLGITGGGAVNSSLLFSGSTTGNTFARRALEFRRAKISPAVAALARHATERFGYDLEKVALTETRAGYWFARGLGVDDRPPPADLLSSWPADVEWPRKRWDAFLHACLLCKEPHCLAARAGQGVGRRWRGGKWV